MFLLVCQLSFVLRVKWFGRNFKQSQYMEFVAKLYVFVCLPVCCVMQGFCVCKTEFLRFISGDWNRGLKLLGFPMVVQK